MPSEKRPYPRTPDWPALLAILILTGVTGALFFKAHLFLGHDWLSYFSLQPNGLIPLRPNPSYPPWILGVALLPLREMPPFLGLALVDGLTLSSLSVLTYRYARCAFPDNRLPAFAALVLVLFNPLPWMMMWLGQVDALVLVGLVMLPFGVPLLLGKPNTGAWAVLNSRRDILWSIGFGILSLILWGLWPLDMLRLASPDIYKHPIVMGWGAIHPSLALLGIGLLLFTDRDLLRLIAAGSFISPYMMPYHYFVLLPAIGRVSGWRQLVLWMTSLLLLAVTAFFTPETKLMAQLFPLSVWVLLTPSLRPGYIRADPDTLLNRGLKQARAIWNMRLPAVQAK
jgi:hypothetical protein